MRNLLLLFVCLIISIIGTPHPGIGIVRDSKGNIFYTDLKQVWKIAVDGKKTIAVPNVHTHELFMDHLDDLYGEHLWYNGERLDTWGHYVWCLHGNGRLDTIINPSEGFLENYSFVRDQAGNMYWADRFKITRFKKRSPDGKIEIIAEGKFKDIRWMYATAEGVVYFIDLVDLYKIEPGKSPQLIAEKLSSTIHALAPLTDARHDLMGIWPDKDDNIYIANQSARVVKRISPEGIISNVVLSPAPWSPTGGLFDDQGNLWLLEYAGPVGVRVRKIPFSELEKEASAVAGTFHNYFLPPILFFSVASITILLIVAGVVITKKRASTETIRVGR